MDSARHVIGCHLWPDGWMGARHVIECNLNHETRAKNAFDDVASTIHQLVTGCQCTQEMRAKTCV